MTALRNSTPPPSEPCYESFSITHAGSTRRINRDVVVERSDIGLWAVADGMGGDNTPGMAPRLSPAPWRAWLLLTRSTLDGA